MEVTLKRSKITSQIMKQALIQAPESLSDCIILGWCFFNERKFIVFYKSDGTIFRYPVFKAITALESSKIKATISFGGNYIHAEYEFKSEKQRFEFVEKMVEVNKQATEKGQFFI